MLPLCHRLFDDPDWHDHCVRLDEGRLDRLRVYADKLVASELAASEGDDPLKHGRTFTFEL